MGGSIMTDMKKEWSSKQFDLRENGFMHSPYRLELAFYNAVREGDVKRVEKLCEDDFIRQEGLGQLSQIPLRNVIYHFIISAALVARYCISGGMEHEAAYGLSDFYIQKADQCTAVEQVSQLHNVMSIDYAKRMNELKKDRIYSKPVTECIDYIYGNLHSRITLSMLADYVKLNPSYLSRLFKQTTGVSASMYIQTKKVADARNLLKYTDFSVSDIASILAYPTQSYFIEVFKKHDGMTPKQYREACFHQIDAQRE